VATFQTGHRCWRALSITALALIGLPEAEAGQPTPGAASWRWESADGGARSLHLRFVRGQIRIVRGPGPIRVEVSRHAIDGYSSDAEILVQEIGGSVLITDRYPRGWFWRHRESLPPIDERGDFWHTIVIIQATIRVPSSVFVRVELMDGWAEGADRCIINSNPRCIERR